MKTARLKKIRRLGTPLPGLTRKSVRQNSQPPGMHGGGRHRRSSGYRLQLEEKQKVRFHYGISEGQLRTVFQQASSSEGDTGENLLALLERRLDSVVFRMGFAPTIPAARQRVAHGHILVNGKRVDRAGFRVSSGDEIAVASRARTIPDVIAAVEKGPEIRLPSFLAVDPDDPFKGRVISKPVRADVPFLVDESAIVEFYAR